MYSTESSQFIVPEMLASQFHLRDGDVVADFGAGSGYFTPVMAVSIGRAGKVLACEIQKNLVERIGHDSRKRGHSNVEVLWCDIEQEGGIPINDGTLDVGSLINTFFQIEDKASMVREIRRVMRSKGVVHVIDWSDSYAGIGPAPEQVVDKDTVCGWFEAEPFVLEREYTVGSHHYGLTFRAI